MGATRSASFTACRPCSFRTAKFAQPPRCWPECAPRRTAINHRGRSEHCTKIMSPANNRSPIPLPRPRRVFHKARHNDHETVGAPPTCYRHTRKQCLPPRPPTLPPPRATLTRQFAQTCYCFYNIYGFSVDLQEIYTNIGVHDS